MFRLTREVRFAINSVKDDQLDHPPANGFAGYPALTGYGQYLELQVTLQGQLQPDSNYLRNISEIDDAVRRVVIPSGDVLNITEVFRRLREVFPGDLLHSINLKLSPYLSIAQLAVEHPMQTRLSQKFEFSASHRLHNPKLSDEQNRSTYGKCNNPFGHGHNYEVQVTVRGHANSSGLIVNVPAFERIVQQHAIEKLDHKNLNVEVPEFKDLIPSVENISKVIFGMLKGQIAQLGTQLASVTVWETPKTWCEYSEDL
jgi:6-pyruvoyltetrahydropterin/6-carboxytetrahydropterin synthase